MLFWLILLATATTVYFAYIRPRIRAYRYLSGILDQVDWGAGSVWQRVKLAIAGFKTVLVGYAAAGTIAAPAVLDQLHQFTGWAVFFEQDTANKVAAALALVTAITHAWGVESAAKAEPKV